MSDCEFMSGQKPLPSPLHYNAASSLAALLGRHAAAPTSRTYRIGTGSVLESMLSTASGCLEISNAECRGCRCWKVSGVTLLAFVVRDLAFLDMVSEVSWLHQQGVLVLKLTGADLLHQATFTTGPQSCREHVGTLAIELLFGKTAVCSAQTGGNLPSR